MQSRLEALVVAYARGVIPDAEFLRLLLQLEEIDVRPNGFTLVSCNTLDEWTHIELRRDATREIWSWYEFLPREDAFRTPTVRGHVRFAEAEVMAARRPGVVSISRSPAV